MFLLTYPLEYPLEALLLFRAVNPAITRRGCLHHTQAVYQQLVHHFYLQLSPVDSRVAGPLIYPAVFHRQHLRHIRLTLFLWACSNQVVVPTPRR